MKYKLNPLLLLLFNFFVPVILMFFSSPILDWYLFVVASVVLLGFQRYLSWVKFLFAYILLQLIGIYGTPYAIGTPVAYLVMLGYMFGKLLPCLMITSVLVKNYTTAELLSALQKLRLPKIFMIALIITLRYIPTFQKEYRYIKESMQLRGITFSYRRPLRSFEYIIVPQLFRCSILAEELTAAGLIKGIDYPHRRTSYYHNTMTIWDYLITLAVVLSVTGVIVCV